MWINAKTEFSFEAVYGHVDQVAKKCKDIGGEYAGIADISNTFGHVRWGKACKKAGIKPIYGVRLPVFKNIEEKERRVDFNMMTFIAKTQDGLSEIYELVDLSHQQFYYRTRISYDQVNNLSNNVIILAGVAPDWSLINHPLVFSELGRHIPFSQRDIDRPQVASIDNYYVNFDDKAVYEPFARDRLRERRTYPLHIPSRNEWLADFPGRDDALENLDLIAKACCNVELPKAPLVKYKGKDKLEQWCINGAKKRRIDISNPGIYKDRYEKEIRLIGDKKFADYFLVVADLIRYAKSKMAVGPSRGSSAGSLVCYLMEITEIDPIKYDLIFERFIDINRADLPDIDIDFQDDKRDMCLKYLEKKYGQDCVAQIGNISRMKAKSAITKFAKNLGVPLGDVEELKDAIMERSGGDARANYCIEDTINDTEIGKQFIEKYPVMKSVAKIEAHADHTSVHAAGVLVCNEPITKYCGVNSREKRIAMIDKKDAEALNLLKIDALGLRTLSILANVCDQIGKPYEWLYEIPVDDPGSFEVLNNQRYMGIFQFEGPAVNGLAKQINIEHIEDIAALTALGRPGPLNSGGANRYITFRAGKEEIKYVHNHSIVADALKPTYGIVVYQEQVMRIVRELGMLSWEDTSAIRKAMSKSLGVEFFDKMWKNFQKGCAENGVPEDEARAIWDNINTMGCLSGDTILENPFPNQNTPREITLKELFNNNGFIRKKTATEINFVNGPRSDKLTMMKKQNLYCMQSGEKIKPARLIDVIESGIKETYNIKLETGESIRATKNHKFYTADGWVALNDLSIGDNIAIMGKRRKGTKNKKFKGTGSGEHNEWHGELKKYIAAVKILKEKNSMCTECQENPYEETHHIDGDRMNNRINNLQPLYRKCHKNIHREKDGGKCIPHNIGKDIIYSKIIFIGDPKIEMTYDISMPAPYHNFVANNIVVHNSWSFNKSHAVSYGLISYLCAYMKAHYPLEFLVANLNHSKSDSSALKILRDAVENDGVKYKYIDWNLSDLNWSVKNNILYGGLKTIHGIGPQAAKKIMKIRSENGSYPDGIKKHMNNSISSFKYLYPGKQLYGDFYDDPQSLGLIGKVTHIKDTQQDGIYTIIGCMIKKNLRDANEACFVNDRGGRYESGQTSWLNLTLEDDTGSVMCKIQKKDYLSLGKDIAESGKEEKDWYIVYGTKKNGWSLIFVKNIAKITRE